MKTTSPPVSARMRRRCGAAGVGVLLASALVYIGSADPHELGSAYPPCPFRVLTGVNCPACGGLRMTYDLLHGDVVAAATDNVFLLVAIPTLAAIIVLRRRRGAAALPMPMMMVVVAAAIVWGVLRNLPGFPLIPAVVTG